MAGRANLTGYTFEFTVMSPGYGTQLVVRDRQGTIKRTAMLGDQDEAVLIAYCINLIKELSK